MLNYVTGNVIKTFRERKGYTQKQLAEILMVSDKAVSKWETQKGLPDISLIEPLAQALGISVAELLSGEYIINKNKCGNMMKGCFYVCPLCSNAIWSTGEGSFSCCGITLPPVIAEEQDDEHIIKVERVEDDYYIRMHHPMSKDHYISFFAFVTVNRVQIYKLYPEQEAEARLLVSAQGIIYAYCNRNGLFMQKLCNNVIEKCNR